MNPSVSGTVFRSRLPCVPCVTGMPNGRQAHHRPLLPPYTQSLLTTPSITRAALRMASGRCRHYQLSHPQPLMLQLQPIASCMACLSKLTHPRQPALTGLPSLATSYSTQSKSARLLCRAQWLFSPRDRKTCMMHACMHRARGRPQA